MAFWKRSTPKADPVANATPQRAATTSSVSPAKPVLPRRPAERSTTADDGPSLASELAKKGFDPYNSGAFDVRDTWGKVIRK